MMMNGTAAHSVVLLAALLLVVAALSYTYVHQSQHEEPQDVDGIVTSHLRSPLNSSTTGSNRTCIPRVYTSTYEYRLL